MRAIEPSLVLLLLWAPYTFLLGRIVELEVEVETLEASLAAASSWEAKHTEALAAAKAAEAARAVMSTEKEEIEKRHFEGDLRATRLQAELLSSKKALRQAVSQLQGLEQEQQQAEAQAHHQTHHLRSSSSSSSSGDGVSINLAPSPAAASFTSVSSGGASTSTSMREDGGVSNLSSASGEVSGGGVNDRVKRIRERMQGLLQTVGDQHAELSMCRKRIDDLEADVARHASAYSSLAATAENLRPPSPAAVLHGGQDGGDRTRFDTSLGVSTNTSIIASSSPTPGIVLPFSPVPHPEGGGGGYSNASMTAPGSPRRSIGARIKSGGGVSSGNGDRGNSGVKPPTGLHELTHLKCAVLEYIMANPDDAAKREQLTAVMGRLLHFSKRETASALAVARQRPSDTDPLSFLSGLIA